MDEKTYKLLVKGLIGAIILVVIIFIIVVIFQSHVPKEFKSQIQLFLVEGERLDAMTTQGVNNGDFRDQLVEVKSSFNIFEKQWPRSLRQEKKEMQGAINLWNATLELWDFGIDYCYDDLSGCLITSEMKEKYSLVCDFTGTNVILPTFSDYISCLMSAGSDRFNESSESIYDKIY